MKMYKERLAKWGFSKNAKVNRDWSAAALLHAERKAQGKNRTTFDIFGSTATVRQLEEHRITRGLSEQDFLFEARAMGMSIPPYIRAKTPEIVMKNSKPTPQLAGAAEWMHHRPTSRQRIQPCLSAHLEAFPSERSSLILPHMTGTGKGLTQHYHCLHEAATCRLTIPNPYDVSLRI
jgi:hypothetical protein